MNPKNEIKVKDVLKLIPNRSIAMILVEDKTYDFNVGFTDNRAIKRCKKIFGHFKTEKEEQEYVSNKLVGYLSSDKSGVITIHTR